MLTQKKLLKDYSQVFISSSKYDSKAVYAKRRRSLMKKMDSVCFFAGMPVDPGCEEAFVQTWTRFVQEPAFLYLTGINQAGCYLVLDPKNGKEILFVPKKDPFKEFWVGKRLGYIEGDDEVSEITGIEDVRPVDALWNFIDGLAKNAKRDKVFYAYFFEKYDGDHNQKFKAQLQSKLRPYKIEIKSCAKEHFDDRLILEDERLMEARTTQAITDKAFRALLSNAQNIKNEREMALYLNYEMQRRSDGDLAFPTIVAGGANACCLHYVKNDENLQKGSLVLLDFGVRFGSLHSDISRTIPVSGKFNPLQKMLYEIVLDAGKFYQKFVKPGVSLRSIGQKPWEYIMEALETRLVKGASGKYKLLYDVRPHGVSHFIGEQIHEGNPGSRSLDEILQPGMLISCEPGVYGEFEAKVDGKFYHEKIGIRIEDDLLITQKGFVNISKNIPRTVEEIEKLMK